MYAKLIPALVALGAAVVSAQSNGLCTQPTITIKAAADATIACQTVENLLFDSAVAGEVIISGPQTIKGDLILSNVTQLISLSSSSVAAIGGKFQLTGLTLLSSLSFTSLASVGEINWTSLTRLRSAIFASSGLTKVTTLQIRDTTLPTLDGINVASLETFIIDNNQRLVAIDSPLTNVTKTLQLTANGLGFTFKAPKLTSILNGEIRDAALVELNALKTVGGSLNFDKNSFQTFTAPNLTGTSTGAISFINNPALTNLTMPVLTKTGGAFTISNNTALEKVNGFNALKSVGGAVTLRGNFTEVTLPVLDDVKGTFTLLSTKDITTSCDSFKKFAPTKQGGNGRFAGNFTCTSNFDKANEGGSVPTGPGGTNNTGGMGTSLSFNLPVVVGMAVLGGLVQAM